MSLVESIERLRELDEQHTDWGSLLLSDDDIDPQMVADIVAVVRHVIAEENCAAGRGGEE